MQKKISNPIRKSNKVRVLLFPLAKHIKFLEAWNMWNAILKFKKRIKVIHDLNSLWSVQRLKKMEKMWPMWNQVRNHLEIWYHERSWIFAFTVVKEPSTNALCFFNSTRQFFKGIQLHKKLSSFNLQCFDKFISPWD